MNSDEVQCRESSLPKKKEKKLNSHQTSVNKMQNRTICAHTAELPIQIKQRIHVIVPFVNLGQFRKKKDPRVSYYNSDAQSSSKNDGLINFEERRNLL